MSLTLINGACSEKRQQRDGRGADGVRRGAAVSVPCAQGPGHAVACRFDYGIGGMGGHLWPWTDEQWAEWWTGRTMT